MLITPFYRWRNQGSGRETAHWTYGHDAAGSSRAGTWAQGVSLYDRESNLPRLLAGPWLPAESYRSPAKARLQKAEVEE